tara:strand:- start:1546 stop:2103 length:558 start_codon:yes stop_codon:yes gene_type:complete
MYIHTNQLGLSNNERGMMTDQDLKAHVEAREAFIKREQETFNWYWAELQKEFTKRNINKLDEIATQSDLHILHLKGFAMTLAHCCDPIRLQRILKRIAIYEAKKSTLTKSAVYHAVHLDNTEYKKSPNDPNVYWSKYRAQIVIDRVLSIYGDKKTALNELTTLFKDINKHGNIDSRSIYNLPTRF